MHVRGWLRWHWRYREAGAIMHGSLWSWRMSWAGNIMEKEKRRVKMHHKGASSIRSNWRQGIKSLPAGYMYVSSHNFPSWLFDIITAVIKNLKIRALQVNHTVVWTINSMDRNALREWDCTSVVLKGSRWSSGEFAIRDTIFFSICIGGPKRQKLTWRSDLGVRNCTAHCRITMLLYRHNRMQCGN